MSNLKGMLIRPEDTKDVSAMLRQWRRDHFRSPLSPGETKRLEDPVKYSQVVCMIPGDPNNPTLGSIGIVMQRRPATVPVIDLTLVGAMPFSESDSFALTVTGGRYSRTGATLSPIVVDMPYRASAEEFHRIAQFPESVRVSLGTRIVAGESVESLYRWRIEQRKSDERVSLAVESEDWSNPVAYEVRVDEWVGTDRSLNYHTPLPQIQATSKRLRSSPSTLEWSGGVWSIVSPDPPANGDVLLFAWVPSALDPEAGTWERMNPDYGFTASIDRRAAVLNDAGDWSLLLPPYTNEADELIADESLPSPPRDHSENTMLVSLVWYQDAWQQTSTINTPYQAGLYGFSRYRYNGTFGDTSLSDVLANPPMLLGAIGIVSWTGHEWVLVEYERRPFFYVENSSGGGY